MKNDFVSMSRTNYFYLRASKRKVPNAPQNRRTKPFLFAERSPHSLRNTVPICETAQFPFSSLILPAFCFNLVSPVHSLRIHLGFTKHSLTLHLLIKLFLILITLPLFAFFLPTTSPHPTTFLRSP